MKFKSTVCKSHSQRLVIFKSIFIEIPPNIHDAMALAMKKLWGCDWRWSCFHSIEHWLLTSVKYSVFEKWLRT